MQIGIEADQRGAGFGGPRQRRQQARHQPGQQLARPHRPGRWIAAVMPAPDNRGDRGPVVEAHFLQISDRFRMILIAGKNQRFAAAKIRRAFEQAGVMALDHCEMTEQDGAEFAAVIMSKERRHGVDFAVRPGQAVSLLVLDHLQAMLDAAQIFVCCNHVRGRIIGNPSGGGQPAQCRAGFRYAQCRVAAAPDQLLGLGEEFDFADAAAAKLDIVPVDGDFAAAAMRRDLPLDRMNIFDGGEIEMLAPNKRA